MSGNNVTIVGNLTRAPELRFTPSGSPVANFGVAVNRRWQNRQTQEWEEQTSFFDVTCWRDLAENVAESLDQGARVVVTGRLERGSGPILDYLREHRPSFHFFGDVHQPQASTWRVGSTVCRNVGYFRATRRPVIFDLDEVRSRA